MYSSKDDIGINQHKHIIRQMVKKRSITKCLGITPGCLDEWNDNRQKRWLNRIIQYDYDYRNISPLFLIFHDYWNISPIFTRIFLKAFDKEKNSLLRWGEAIFLVASEVGGRVTRGGREGERQRCALRVGGGLQPAFLHQPHTSTKYCWHIYINLMIPAYSKKAQPDMQQQQAVTARHAAASGSNSQTCSSSRQ